MLAIAYLEILLLELCGLAKLYICAMFVVVLIKAIYLSCVVIAWGLELQ